jgi:hypothetical protein
MVKSQRKGLFKYNGFVNQPLDLEWEPKLLGLSKALVHGDVPSHFTSHNVCNHGTAAHNTYDTTVCYMHNKKLYSRITFT